MLNKRVAGPGNKTGKVSEEVKIPPNLKCPQTDFHHFSTIREEGKGWGGGGGEGKG